MARSSRGEISPTNDAPLKRSTRGVPRCLGKRGAASVPILFPDDSITKLSILYSLPGRWSAHRLEQPDFPEKETHVQSSFQFHRGQPRRPERCVSPTRARCFHPSIIDGVCFLRFRSPCFSAPEERGQSIDRSHTVKNAMFSARFQTGHPTSARSSRRVRFPRRRKTPSTALQRYQLFPDQRTTAGSRVSKIRQTEVSRLMLNRLVTDASARVVLRPFQTRTV
jgi:hypothetical protein